jgi:hypothetical protein
MNEEQRSKIAHGTGFLAALDQSGGSTPKALAQYGVPDSAYSTDAEMFDLMHDFRRRILAAPAFDGRHILGAILFEQTMDRDVDGVGTAQFLWEHKKVVPFVKVDEGLAAEADGVRVMKPFTNLETLLRRAVDRHVFGTKMRSLIIHANAAGVDAVLDLRTKTICPAAAPKPTRPGPGRPPGRRNTRPAPRHDVHIATAVEQVRRTPRLGRALDAALPQRVPSLPVGHGGDERISRSMGSTVGPRSVAVGMVWVVGRTGPVEGLTL